MPGNPFDQFDSAQPPQQVITNPLKVQETQANIGKTGADAAEAAARTAGINTDNATKVALQAPTLTKAQADAAIANAKAEEARRTLATLPPALATLETRDLSNDEIFNTIQRARGYTNSWDATGVPSAVLSSIPGNDAYRLNKAVGTLQNQIAGNKMMMGRADGNGSQRITQSEFHAFGDSIAPLDQGMGKQDMQQSLAAVEQHYRRLKAAEAGYNPDDPKVQAAYGIIPSNQATPVAVGGQPPAGPGGSPPGAPPTGGAPMGGPGAPPTPGGPAAPTGGMITNGGQFVADPALAGVNAHIRDMIVRQGATAPQIRAYLETIRPGMSAMVPGLDDAVAQHNADPKRAVSVDVEKAWKPASPVAQMLGAAAMTPLGTGAINAADMASMGTLDNMTSNPAMTRAVMRGVSDANPNAALLGQIAGGALGATGAEMGAGALGLKGLTAARAADAAYGAAYGAGSDDDNRLAGAATGAIGGSLGGMFGRGLSRAAGALASGVINPAAKALADSGVPLTVGQALGGSAKSLEDKLTSVPIVGGAIKARRADGYNAMNNAAFNLGLQPIGADVGKDVGENAVTSAQDAVSKAYSDALDGTTFKADPQFAIDLHNAKQAGMAIPQLGDQFGHMVDNRVTSLMNNGQITGRGFQDALRGVRDASSAAKGEIMGHEFGNAASGVEDALRGLVQRQQPDLLPKYDAANAAYRNLSTLQNAVLAGHTTNGVFSPAQLGIASKQNAIKYGGKNAAAAGDRPFFDFQRAAQNVLPSTVPNSGTADRLKTAGMFAALGGLGGGVSNPDNHAEGAGIGALTLGAIGAAPYSKMGSKAIQALLLNDRPAILKALGDRILNASGNAGRVSAPLAAQAALGYGQ